MNARATNTACLVGLMFSIGLAHGGDWPQFRGPERNGQSLERKVLAAWAEGGPARMLWRTQVGRGHSAVSVANGLAYTAGWDGQRETVWCFEAATGREVWRQSYPSKTIQQWPGPRATPTAADGVVFTLGQHGQLRAWDAKTGTPRWSVDLARSYQPDVDYGFMWSPLVEGRLLLLGAGSRGLALRIEDGSFAWGADEKPGACASPVPFVTDGERGVALVTMSAARDSTTLVGLEPRAGAVLWSSPPWPEKWGAVCNDLLVADDSVFVTSAETYSRGARFRLDGQKLKPVWESPKVSSYTGNAVLIGGHLFLVTKAGLLKCVDWVTGAETWSQRGFGTYGALMAADGKLFVQASNSGELVIVEASAASYIERRRMNPFNGKGETFTAPALAHGRLYVRSYAGEVVCLQVGATAQ
jgi:outer membrane protein assembly factor BamB